MRTAVSIAALFLVVANVGTARVSAETALRPTSFEAFAGQPGVRVAWFKDVGRIDAGEASVAVTALVVEDTSLPARRMRGVRIDLANRRATDRVFLEASKLAAVKDALQEIDRELPSQLRIGSNAAYRYFGAAEFWHPGVRVHALNAAYYIAPDSSGLSLSAYNAQEFRFPDHTPSELATVLTRAIDELKTQP